MQGLLLWLIGCYRRFLSPYKGFRCVYRVRRGGLSCSAFGARAVQRHGAAKGVAVLRRRMRICGHVHAHSRQAEAGHCDLPIVDCDMGHNCASASCSDSALIEWLSCDCGCDMLQRKFKAKPSKQTLHPSLPAQEPPPGDVP